MKNQTDLIFSIVAIVLAIVGVVVIMQTKRRVVTLPKPEQPNLEAVQAPKPEVKMSPGLGSGSGSGGAGGSSGRPRRGGGGRVGA